MRTEEIDALHLQEHAAVRGVYVCFECGSECRWSAEYGPFPYVQLTGKTIITENGFEIALLDDRGVWCLVHGDAAQRLLAATGVQLRDEDQVPWTDVVIYQGPNHVRVR